MLQLGFEMSTLDFESTESLCAWGCIFLRFSLLKSDAFLSVKEGLEVFLALLINKTVVPLGVYKKELR
jgi:hypothetical protein